MTLEDMEAFLIARGQQKYRAAQIMKWIHQGLVDNFEPMTNLSKSLRLELSDHAHIGVLRHVSTQTSVDNTAKFLFQLSDGLFIESVLIPETDHDTLCISTQVGCAMGCRICRTAKMGLQRNLSSGEIVGQLLAVRRIRQDSRITNVVFMGMGEPLANFENTVRAITILSHPNGPQISWRRLTVSTSGIVPKILELGSTVRAKLAVSLNAVTDEQRSHIMPINRAYPLAKLMQALQSYPLPRRDRITFEYVMRDGFNDSDADARHLVRLLNPVRAKVNLIPFNDELSDEFRTPSAKRVSSFQDILMSKSLVAIVRKSRGRDIMAACGQLASQKAGG
jgi:23S rRNA (adenine2503-C2)-methyltransferase